MTDDGLLQLADEPRIETYEIKSDITGYIVEVSRNCETGETTYRNTERTELTVTDGS